MKHLSIFKNENSRREHGGSLLVGRRRKHRPLSTKTPLHLVLRSDFAWGSRSLLRHRPLIEAVIKKASLRFGVRVYEKAIVRNHIHLVVQGKRRIALQNFFRVVAGHIAQEILRSFPILPSERGAGGAPKAAGGFARAVGSKVPKTRESENKFWQTRIYSRILTWGRELKTVRAYLVQNTLEALGLIPYQNRKKAAARSPTAHGGKRFNSA